MSVVAASSIDLSSFRLNSSSSEFYRWHSRLGHVSGNDENRNGKPNRNRNRTGTGTVLTGTGAIRSGSRFPYLTLIGFRFFRFRSGSDRFRFQEPFKEQFFNRFSGLSILSGPVRVRNRNRCYLVRFPVPTFTLNRVSGKSVPVRFRTDYHPYLQCMRYLVS